MSKKVGVVLAGCGVYDGSEIHESVVTLLALDRAGAEIHCFAPSIDFKVKNHLTGELTDETRNTLVEAARIARGEIQDLAECHAEALDAVFFPGGFGAALHLSDFGVKGTDCTVHPEVQRVIDEFIDQSKPIGAMCIAPATVARALANKGVSAKVTLGTDPSVAGKIEAMGGIVHASALVEETVVDQANKLVTTPAYMLGPSVAHVSKGIEKLVSQVLAIT